MQLRIPARPGKDAYDDRFAWTQGPDEIPKALRKANIINDDGTSTRFVKDARTSYPLGDADAD